MQTPRGIFSILAAIATLAGSAGCVQFTTAQPPLTPFPVNRETPTSPAAPASGQTTGEPWLLVSVEEFGYAHLFSFGLHSSSLTRLTSGDWNDFAPALSPDGHLVAFASDRGGFWDLFTLDLTNGTVSQITNTPEYDGSPAWSPDGVWMAYETYLEGQLDVVVRSMTDAGPDPVRVTDDPAADRSPAWSPDGRKIAFVSTRTGDADVWLADLDKTAGRFSDLSNSPQAAEDHPVWHPDGSRLAWASAASLEAPSGIYAWDESRPSIAAAWVGSGTWPVWSPSGQELAAAQEAPTVPLLSAFTLEGKPLMLPFSLPGRVHGMAWPQNGLPEPLPGPFNDASQAESPRYPEIVLTRPPDVPSDRWSIVPVADVQAPDAGLHARAAAAFVALRQRVILESGWDPLASLESTFVPLTTPLEPGLGQDWLYTGRAIVINTLMLNAGWMSVQREDIGDQTYWRLFIRARDQDGSQGIPITDPPWDLNLRYQLEPQAYEAGGDYAPVPSGYWIDLTALAEIYGWHRLPSLPNWRTYYAGSRFSEFAYTEGLDWYSAMLQLYPAEALVTATPVLPPTITPSRTPRPTTTPYPTWTSRPTRTPSITPTPLPPTLTQTPTHTPVPTETPPTIIPVFPSPTP